MTFLILSGCNRKATTESSIEDLQRKELDIKGANHKDIGNLISEISFEVKATQDEAKDWDNGIIPWVSIAFSQSEINNLIEADEIVISDSEVEIYIDYPLNNPFKFKLKSDFGFSRKQLILAISKKYKAIYEEEENTAKVKTVPLNQRKGIINRNETDGKYGIWGHDLEDLDLSTIEVYRNKENKLELVLGIES